MTSQNTVLLYMSTLGVGENCRYDTTRYVGIAEKIVVHSGFFILNE